MKTFLLLFSSILFLGCDAEIPDKNEIRNTGITRERIELNWRIDRETNAGELVTHIIYQENVDQYISSGYSVTCDSGMMCKISWREK